MPVHHPLLDPALKVPRSAVLWYFIANFYDGPISGLATFQGEILRFCCFREDIPEQHIFALQRLSSAELAEELRVKSKFEMLVGTHWSFDRFGKPLPKVTQPEATAQRFYNEEAAPRETEPQERPIVAWFDLREE